jgi:uncharacterized membrane protein
MKRFKGRLRQRRGDEKGVTLLIVAVSMTLILAACALSVDIGLQVVLNRSLQTVADSGALDAVGYINGSDACVAPPSSPASTQAQTEAQNAAKDNTSDSTISLYEGNWNSTTNQFAACTAPFNAVSVTAAQTLSHQFQPGTATLSRSAVAVQTPVAGFSIGTYLANFSSQQSQALNGLLSALTPGTNLGITAVGYDGLASANVTLQQLIDASGGLLTTNNVLTAQINPGRNLVSWVSKALTNQGNNAAVTDLSSILSNAGAPTTVQLCKVISVEGSSCTSSALGTSALTSSLNVLQLLQTDAEFANGGNAVTLGTNLSLGSIASVSLSANLIQPPQVAYGPAGTVATTSQVNVTLNVCVVSVIVCTASVSIPVTGAEGTATLGSISCPGNVATSTPITVATNALTTSLVVSVLGLGLINVPLSISAVSGTTLTFTPPPAYGPSDIQSVGSSSPTATVGSGPNVVSALLNTLTTSLGPILQALGVTVGGAQVAALSATCGAAALAQ